MTLNLIVTVMALAWAGTVSAQRPVEVEDLLRLRRLLLLRGG